MLQTHLTYQKLTENIGTDKKIFDIITLKRRHHKLR